MTGTRPRRPGLPAPMSDGTAHVTWEPTAPRATGSARTEALIAPGPQPEPVLVFHHIQKTAGTALRRMLRADLAGCERLTGTVVDLHDRSRDELAAWYRAGYESLGARRAALRCVMGHTASYMIPLLGERAFPVTVVRDPVDRVVSLYYNADANLGKPLTPTGRPLAGFYREPDPATLIDLYDKLGGCSPRHSRLAFRHTRFFNGQARSLLAPHYNTLDLAFSSGPPPDADLWRERLLAVTEGYLLGVHERLPGLVARLRVGLGGAAELPLLKVNRARPPLAEVPADVAETIRGFNWLDQELHSATANFWTDA